MYVYVVRHAQSRENVHDPSLTQKGLDQADRLGRRLSQIDFDAVLCGPLHRHVATAEKIVKYQSIKRVEIFSDLGETTVPDYPGMPIEILRELYPNIDVIPSPASEKIKTWLSSPQCTISAECFTPRL